MLSVSVKKNCHSENCFWQCIKCLSYLQTILTTQWLFCIPLVCHRRWTFIKFQIIKIVNWESFFSYDFFTSHWMHCENEKVSYQIWLARRYLTNFDIQKLMWRDGRVDYLYIRFCKSSHSLLKIVLTILSKLLEFLHDRIVYNIFVEPFASVRGSPPKSQ